jgi:hypothetical protein
MDNLQYTVYDEEILALTWGGSFAEVLHDKVRGFCYGLVNVANKRERPAEVGDFMEHGVSLGPVYVLYSANEAICNDGAGFWNKSKGYVDFKEANVFSQEEVVSLEPPMSLGGDARYREAKDFLPSLR